MAKDRDEIIAAVLDCRDPDAVYGIHVEKLVTVLRWLPKERDRVAAEEASDMQDVHDDLVAFKNDLESKV